MASAELIDEVGRPELLVSLWIVFGILKTIDHPLQPNQMDQVKIGVLQQCFQRRFRAMLLSRKVFSQRFRGPGLDVSPVF